MAQIVVSKRIESDIDLNIPWNDFADTCFKVTKKENFINHEIVLSFVQAEEIRELNKTYRHKDYITDVLSFAATGEFADEERCLGDIVICVAKAGEQASEHGHELRLELIFLFIHGLLHLLDYDHENSEEAAKEMFSLQNKVLEEHGLLCESLNFLD